MNNIEPINLISKLDSIEKDLKILINHIEQNCNDAFEQPTLSKHGDVYSEKAWYHIYNIMFTCRFGIKDHVELQNNTLQ